MSLVKPLVTGVNGKPAELDPADTLIVSALSVSGNTTLGAASGDTLTVNAAAWVMPNAIKWTKTQQVGVAEDILKFKISDSGSIFSVVNGTTNIAEFAPVFNGVIEVGFNSTALSFFGTKGSSSTTNPNVLFLGRYNSGTELSPVMVDVPDAGVLAQFRNRATNLVNIFGNGDLTLVKSGGKLGYGTGAGGAVTQGSGSGKATGVTLSKSCGAITMNNATLNAGTIVSFVLTNTVIAATDVLVLNHVSGGTPGSYTLNTQCGASSATINVRNNTGGNLAEAIVLQFVVIKGVNS